jgi:O-methyltransferase
MNCTPRRIWNSITHRTQDALTSMRYLPLWQAYRRMRPFTMIPKVNYLKNLRLVEHFQEVPGDVVECGTWRGGMIGGIALRLGAGRRYFLLDSFEGLPKAQAIDGQEAIAWQKDTSSPLYFNNCAADIEDARRAMAIAGATKVELLKGWFKDTLPRMPSDMQIAVLRLDGDWYDSTMECLEALYPKVVVGGVIIIDDYSAWAGCRKAVHDYLSRNQLDVCIHQFSDAITYLVKRPAASP